MCVHHWRCEDNGITVNEICMKCGECRTITPRWITGDPVFGSGFNRPPPLDIPGPTGNWRGGHQTEMIIHSFMNWRLSNQWDNGVKALEARV